MSAPPPLGPKKWARAKQSGAHGLRRGAWYAVVNEGHPKMAVLSVRKHNVPVPREMLEFSDGRPTQWSVVQWQDRQRGAQRASEANEGLTYAVCPACGERARLDPPDTKRITCAHCHGDFTVDWEHPC